MWLKIVLIDAAISGWALIQAASRARVIQIVWHVAAQRALLTQASLRAAATQLIEDGLTLTATIRWSTWGSRLGGDCEVFAAAELIAEEVVPAILHLQI